jgi:protein-tyrosine-phosphatase
MTLPENSWVTHVRLVARAVRHSPDRALHPARRRAQQRRLQRVGLPRTVLFVCHGNICRSPYAAHAFQRVLPPVLAEYMTVISAGFIGPDRPAPATAIEAAAARGIDLRGHRSALLSAEFVRAMDLTIVMEAVQRDQATLWYGADPRRVVVLGDLDPQPIDTRTVRDPILQPLQVFSDTYARIDRCVAELYRHMTGEEPAKPAAPAPSGGGAGERPGTAPERAAAGREQSAHASKKAGRRPPPHLEHEDVALPQH